MLRFALFTCLSFSACVGDVSDESGSAVAQIAVVPPDVACVRIIVTGPSRSTDRFFNVTAGQSATLNMAGLPTGQDSFLGEAYSGICSSVNTATVPTWLSDPTVVTLVPGSTASVSLKLSHNANANVTVDFVDDGGSANVDGGATDLKPGDGGLSG